MFWFAVVTSQGWILEWHHNGDDCVSNHQPHDCLVSRLFRCRSKKTSKLHVTGLYAGNSPVTGESPAQMASNTENFSIWWRHHDISHSDGSRQTTNASLASWFGQSFVLNHIVCFEKYNIFLKLGKWNFFEKFSAVTLRLRRFKGLYSAIFFRVESLALGPSHDIPTLISIL